MKDKTLILVAANHIRSEATWKKYHLEALGSRRLMLKRSNSSLWTAVGKGRQKLFQTSYHQPFTCVQGPAKIPDLTG